MPITLVVIFAVAALLIFKGPSKKEIAQNEKAAVAALKALYAGLDKYKKDNLFYPTTLSSLGLGLLSTQYLEDANIVMDEYPVGPTGLFMYSYNGYWYLYQPADDRNKPMPMNYKDPSNAKISRYIITAFPTKPNRTGVRRFKMSQDGKMFIEQFEEGKPPQLIPYVE